MNYCCVNDQRTGTCYFEFQKGKFSDRFRLEDSLYLSADIFDSLNLYRVFAAAVPEFNYYGITEINREKWNLVKLTADEAGGPAKSAIDEIDSWITFHLSMENTITILGI